MKLYRLTFFVTLLFLATGCTDQAELKAARDRITKLQLELQEERAKKPSPPAPPLTDKVTSKVRTTEPAPNPKSKPSGQQWTYVVRENKMTGGDTRHAYVQSSNTVKFGSPYGGAQRGRLTLRSDSQYGLNVIFSIERGQLLCRSYKDCDVLVRFDEGKPEQFAAIGPADNSTETVFIRNYDRFLGKLRKAQIVKISLNVYQEGAPVFEFDVSGFNEAKYVVKK